MCYKFIPNTSFLVSASTSCTVAVRYKSGVDLRVWVCASPENLEWQQPCIERAAAASWELLALYRRTLLSERHWYANARPDKVGTGLVAYVMDVAAKIGRNLVSKHQIQPEDGAGWRVTGGPNPSREIKLSGANGDREILIFPDQMTTSRIDNLTRLIHTLLYIYDHTYSLMVYSTLLMALCVAVSFVRPVANHGHRYTAQKRAAQRRARRGKHCLRQPEFVVLESGVTFLLTTCTMGGR